MNESTPLPGRAEGTKPKPPKKRVAQAIVRCEGFRCEAYLGKDGKWHAVADDSPLEVLEVVLRFS